MIAPTGFTPKYTSESLENSTPPSAIARKMAAGAGLGSGVARGATGALTIGKSAVALAWGDDRGARKETGKALTR